MSILRNAVGRLTGRPLEARTNKDEVIYAVGDIHGRYDLFSKMMAQIESDWEARKRDGLRFKVIILGDFIDRGPDTQRLIACFMALRDSPRLVVLSGNHEELMLASTFGNPSAQRRWFQEGGLQSLQSYQIAPRGQSEDPHAFGGRIATAVSPEVIEWMRDLPASTRSGDYFFCHAGVRPGVALARQSHEDLMWIRKPFMDSDRYHGAVIVHGHNVVEQVELRPNRISLDTQAYLTGRLSAVCLSGRERTLLSVSDSQ